MTPTIGRIVHYWSLGHNADQKPEDRTNCLASIITAVWSETVVNLYVFPQDPYGVPDAPFYRTSVQLNRVGGESWSWPEIVK